MNKKEGDHMVKIIGTAHGRDAEFTNGADISVTDGHLYVYQSDRSTIAIFAPGTWRDAIVEFPRAS